MNLEEFSNEFDVMLQEYAINPQFGKGDMPITCDEYEKSIFLTKAQEQLVLTIYKGDNDNAFEITEETRRYLSPLIKTYEVMDLYINKNDWFNKGIKTPDYNLKTRLLEAKLIKEVKDIDGSDIFGNIGTVYKIERPNDIYFITYEQATLRCDDPCIDGRKASVIPVTQDELYRTGRNPFRGSSEKRVLRLDTKTSLELISKYNIGAYLLRYISKPKPIILVPLPDGLSIENYNVPMECMLGEPLHRRILDLAVVTAIQTKQVSIAMQQPKQEQQAQSNEQ